MVRRSRSVKPRGGKDEGAVASTEAPTVMAMPEKRGKQPSEEDFILAADRRATAILIGATLRFHEAAKTGKVENGKVDVTFTDEELKLTGRALGWLAVQGILPEEVKGGRRRRQRGGVAPAVMALTAIVTFLFGAFSANNIYNLKGNVATVTTTAYAEIRDACPARLLEPPPQPMPGWFGYVDPRDTAAVNAHAADTAHCKSVTTTATGRINAAQQAYTDAWNRVPATVGAVGTVAAIGVGAPQAVVTALTTLTGAAVTGALPSPLQLQATVLALNDLAGDSGSSSAAAGTDASAAAGTGLGGRRKTKKSKKSKRRSTQRAIRFAY
jgi:hypothetical protein